MVKPNWDLMFWIILISWLVNLIIGLIAGIANYGDEKKYGVGDIIGPIILGVLAMVILFT